MRRRASVLVVLLLAATAAAGRQAQSTGHDRAAWRADYQRIKAGMAQHYANLDWVRDHRNVDLAALDRQTLSRIESSRSRRQAESALRDFVAAFRDPHLELVDRSPSPAFGAGQDEPDPPAGADCAATGYGDGRIGFARHFSRVPGWRLLAEGAFPSALVGDSGVIRIASFREQDYAAACRRAFRSGMSERALQLAVRADLQRELAATIMAMKARGIGRLIVDLTGNGGGSEWDREAVALFTGMTMRRAEPRRADPACDRSSVWRGARPCPIFPAPAGVATIAGTGAWTGPVWVLIDGGTASAAEEFAGWLNDNRAARLIGETSYGAGCGYVDGGAPVALRAAPLVLKMPNCARFTAAGRNEIEGWPPDIVLPNARRDPAGWARGLSESLRVGAR